MKTDTKTLIEAMRILSCEIQSGDGVANAAIAEAANRLEELQTKLEKCKAYFNTIKLYALSRKGLKLYTAAKEACQ